jgi:nitroreductase
VKIKKGGKIMDFFNVVGQRYSVRSYRPDPVEPEKLQQVLEAARLAPTACNLQAFKVIVVKTAGRQAELQRIYHQDWFGAAPYVLAVCSIPQKAWVRSGDRKSYADVDAAIVMDHMILAATALDLGTCWIGAFDAQAAREVLNLDDAWEPVVLTPLGYSRDTAVNRGRKSLKDLVIYQ